MDSGITRGARRLMVVAWPAFLVAGLLEMLVFALVDPQDLLWAGHALEWSREAVYTAAFFAFWALALLGCGLTAVLALSPQQINEPEPSAQEGGRRGAAATPADPQPR